MSLRHRLAAACALALVTAATGAAHAAGPDPLGVVAEAQRDANDAVRGLGNLGEKPFPPPGFAYTSVTWSANAGGVPVFTGPNAATTHPSSWSCSTSVSGTTAHASCTPLGAPDPGTTAWYCYDPFVVVDLTAPAVISPSSSLRFAAGAVAGTARCGGSVAHCVASNVVGGTTVSLSNLAVAHCQDYAFPHALAPLECDADFSAAVNVAWTVKCAPVDP